MSIVRIPKDSWFTGCWIVAPEGAGKTTLLSALLKTHLKEVEDGEASIILFDPKGDMIQHARQLQDFGPGGRLEGRLALIELDEKYPLSINPLDVGASRTHTIAFVEHLFSGLLEAAPTPRQSNVIRFVLHLCAVIPKANLYTFRHILQHGWEDYKEYVKLLKPIHADFFLDGTFDSKDYITVRRDQVKWRIDNLLTTVDLLTDMFQATETRIPLSRMMDAGMVVLIDTSYGKLTVEGSEFFSRIFISMIRAAGEQRTQQEEKTRLPCYVYMDEAHIAIHRDTDVDKMLRQLRAQKIAMIFAHQSIVQITSEAVKTALADRGIRIANPDDEAHELAARFRTTKEFLQTIPKGSFALYVRDYITTPVIARVPNRPIKDERYWPKMHPYQLEVIRQQMRAAFCIRNEEEETEEPQEAQQEAYADYREVNPDVILLPDHSSNPEDPDDPPTKAR